MKNWLNQHAQAFQLVISRIKRHLTSSLLIFAVIGVTLAIPSLMYVVVHNLGGLVDNVKVSSQVSVFIEKDANDDKLYEIKNQLGEHKNIKSIRFVSKEDALAKLKESTENQDLIDTLGKNPLPDAYFLDLVSTDKEDVDALISEAGSIKGVKDVIVDGAWLNRLNSVINIGQQAILILGGLLSFALIAVVSNTVRMQIMSHIQEIEVSRLFGATKNFIRRPFLYMGTLYGLGGGIFACLILSIVTFVFNQEVVKLAQEYQSDFSLDFNLLPTFISMILLAGIIGWLASFLAVSLNSNKQ